MLSSADKSLKPSTKKTYPTPKALLLTQDACLFPGDPTFDTPAGLQLWKLIHEYGPLPQTSNLNHATLASYVADSPEGPFVFHVASNLRANLSAEGVCEKLQLLFPLIDKV